MAVPALDHHAKGYGSQQAYWMGMAAKLAYNDEAEIRAETAKWGFDRCQVFHTKHQMPFPIEDTQAYTVASDRMILSAFRGTEPAQIRSDVNTPPVPGPGGKGFNHYGFHSPPTCWPRAPTGPGTTSWPGTWRISRTTCADRS